MTIEDAPTLTPTASDEHHSGREEQILGSKPSGQKERVAKATSHAPGAVNTFGEECAVAAHTKQGSVWRHGVG